MIVALLIICVIFAILYIFAQAHNNEDLQYGIYLYENLRHLDKLKQRLEADRVNRSQNFF